MNEHDFKERYAALQERVSPSPELDRRTASQARAAHEGAGRQKPTPRATSGGLRRWAVPAAACLAAAAIVAGGIPLVTASLDQGAPAGIAMSDAAAASGFSVRAWAADGSSMLALGQDGTVVFDRDTSTGLHNPPYYQTEGYFTGCLFRIEGEGIARVQMNVTRGAIYSQIGERFTHGEEPDRWAEILSWKPTKRGTGTFAGYDMVTPISGGDGLPKDSPQKLAGANFSKLLGGTVDVSAEDLPELASGEVSFGLWTNDPYPEDGNSFNAVVDLFDGQTLTVTVTFEDGRTSTQVIELHAAPIKIAFENGQSQLLPETDAEEGALHSLYGTVVETSSDPFPLPLDNANDRAGEVLPALVL
ncbi:hypothetical protein [Arabiibacter massiliensis]|uniref:hypothetical protein n=1 Tax=Arabiibacter massiliensis TaxID=1870985 RepID=UPI0009BA9402|nr:hypothetical protein [Arabiibacter massiliensis]